MSAEAIDFLRRAIAPGACANVVAIHPDDGGIQAQGFTTADLSEVDTFLRSHADWNLYWSTNPLRSALSKKATKPDVAEMSYVHVDIDELGEAIEMRVASYPLRPTITVMSGGGFQLFWKLRTPIRANGNLAELEAANKRVEHDFSADHCHNLDRIMRLPGTTNWPNAKKKSRGRGPVPARLVEFVESRVYDLADFPPLKVVETPAPPTATRVDESADLMSSIARAVNRNIRDWEVKARFATHPHVVAMSVNDRTRAIQRCIDKVREKQKKPDAPAGEPQAIFNPNAAIITLDSLLVAPPDPQFVVENYFPLDVGCLFGPGGGNKTTLALVEGVRTSLGFSIHGRALMRPGRTLFLTAEDPRARFLRRLYMVCDAMKLTDEQRRIVADSLLIEDIVGKGIRLVAVDRDGNLTQTSAVDQLIEAYAGKGIVVVNIDPLVYLGPGERFVNDAEASMMQAAHRISSGLGAAVRYLHHTGKQQAREGISDQYAGRGGSALSDGSRFVHVLNRIEKRPDAGAPAELTDLDFEKGRVMTLTVPKLTDAPPMREPIWLRREGWTFEHFTMNESSPIDAIWRDINTITSFLNGEMSAGRKHTASSLEDELKALRMSQKRLRAAIVRGLLDGAMVNRDLPKEECHGRLKAFLAPKAGAV